MKTVREVIEALRQFPPDALVYAYEGEETGIVVCKDDADGKREYLGMIDAEEPPHSVTRTVNGV